ncbi:MAG TPA: hypothetical protein VFH43_10805 [Candidatus Kapabacteria bacterium]|nr:hypothetical protein [Candidatus Kapabacteria bacterium]
MKTSIYTLLFIVSSISLTDPVQAQKRKAVGAKEVTGTFQDCFSEEYCNEIKIQALGKNKLRVSFEGYYPWANGEGANVGFVTGVARIDADTAVFSSTEFEEECRIIIRFKQPGQIEVEHVTPSFNCGFGANVMVDGTYKKVDSKKPKFRKPEEG